MARLAGLCCLLSLVACSPSGNDEVDRLNDLSYSFHYRDLDSTYVYARRALSQSENYADGRAEALNNMAFVCMARMEYKEAYNMLDSVGRCSDNQVELLVADVQLMRLCQRESRNKEFYDYRERASKALSRIEEEWGTLPERIRRRAVYARSEYAIVNSTYYYYVGLKEASIEAINEINPEGEILNDSAQWASYLYHIGSGGILTSGTQEDIEQKEWEYLVRCYTLARLRRYIYWEANALQAMSEHLSVENSRVRLMRNNPLSIQFVNVDHMPDSLMAGYLAQRSLNLFISYGDVYQVASAYRTLAMCHWAFGDNQSALICLENALNGDSAIQQAPDLVASIRERLSLVYSAMDDKPNSDYNRNIYLDMQEKTRQDRQLEARAEQLDHNAVQLNIMIAGVLLLIIILVVSMFFFDRMRKKKESKSSLAQLLIPLQQWQHDNERKISEIESKHEEISEAYAQVKMNIADNKRRNMDNRAKLFLVNSAMPMIDRLINEIAQLLKRKEAKATRKERYTYITELTDNINDCNVVLTEWIKLRQGQLNLKIESFRLQDVLDIIRKGDMAFKLKGIELNVAGDTHAIVKADKTLTLFMLNTMADNARKFTPEGGHVDISSSTADDYVEISVKDTGEGIDAERIRTIFSHKVADGHGFGLMNCKGIIEKYRKTSKLFSVCDIGVESEKGKGSRFFFRLPKGVMRLILMLLMMPLSSHVVGDDNMPAAIPDTSEIGEQIISMASVPADSAETRLKTLMLTAGSYADSAYYSNINGTYDATIQWADSVRKYFNMCYITMRPDGTRLMTRYDDGLEPAEITWLHDGLPFDYNIILDVRNESAVAALALHDWPLYKYNNSVYTKLYKETSADRSLDDYVSVMQRVESNKTVAVILLLLLLVVIVIAYYTLYYRHRIYFRFCVDQIKSINDMLAEDISDKEKLHRLNNEYSTLNFPESLKDIVEKIRAELENSVRISEAHSLSIEIAEDELHRAEYENQKLHICNNVMDNCLSTLKHETMYYPSRIRQLIDAKGDNIKAIDELARYYKQLYSILSLQAASQSDNVNFDCSPIPVTQLSPVVNITAGSDLAVNGDKVMMEYLFDLLHKENGADALNVEAMQKDGGYMVLTLAMPAVEYRDFFTPSTQNVPFLVCRQIIRENSKDTSLHECGIVAEARSGGGTMIIITLADAKAHNIGENQ